MCEFTPPSLAKCRHGAPSTCNIHESLAACKAIAHITQTSHPLATKTKTDENEDLSFSFSTLLAQALTALAIST